jgi:hypothetical protein
MAAGIVVAAPIDTSVNAIARRRDSGILFDSSNPSPAANAARVPTMNPNMGGVSTTVFMTHRGANAAPQARECISKALSAAQLALRTKAP